MEIILKGKLMHIWKSASIFIFAQYLHLCMKTINQRIHIKTPFTFWNMCTWDMWKVCLQTFINNRIRLKLAYVLRNLQTSQENNSRILRIKKVKFSGQFSIWKQTYRVIFKSAIVKLWDQVFERVIV